MLLSDATALKVGSRAVTAAYLGARTVWSGGGTPALDIAEVRSILASLNAVIWIPGPNGAERYGYTTRNYVESVANTLTASAGVVGFVRDSRSVNTSTIAQFTFDSTTEGFETVGSSATLTNMSGAGRVTIVSGTITGASKKITTVVGQHYEVSVKMACASGASCMIRAARDESYGTVLAETLSCTSSTFAEYKVTFVATSTTTAIYLRITGTTGHYADYDDIVVSDLSGVQAKQATTQYKPTLIAVADTYCWRFDSDDALSATFPAGWESSTVIYARSTGYVTQAAQNIVGARTISGAGDLYGLTHIPSTPTSDQLTKIQAFANLLAGV